MSDTTTIGNEKKHRDLLTQRINRLKLKTRLLNIQQIKIKKNKKNKIPLANSSSHSTKDIYCTLTIETQNVQGFKERKQWLQDFKRPGGPSILGLQETHVATQAEATHIQNDFRRIMGYNNTVNNLAFFPVAPGRRGGVGIVINPNAHYITNVQPFIQDRWSSRLVAISFTFYTQKWVYLNIYASNRKVEREAFYRELQDISFPEGTAVLMGGDFNVVVDKIETTRHHESPKLEELLQKFQLIDPQITVIDKYQLNNKPYRWQKYATWCRQAVHRRLDRFYIPVSCIKQVHMLSTEAATVASDHKRVGLKLHPQTCPQALRNPTQIYPWFGINQEEKLQISQYIKDLLSQSQLTAPKEWQRIKGSIIKFLKTLRKQSIHKSKSKFRTKIRKLTRKLILAKPEQVRTFQNQLLQQQHKWRVYKANFKIGNKMIQGENSNKLFFRRVNSKFTKSPILELLTPEGEIHHPKQLSNAMGAGWQETMNPKRGRNNVQSIQEFFSKHKNPLNSKQQQELLRPFEEEEVLEVFRTLKPDKAPGPDGLVNNWYKDFSTVLIPAFLTLTNYWLQTQNVPDDFSTCIITSLKKTPNSKKPLDFRPISLLNTDYKILTKFIPNRVKGILPQVIHMDQAGFVPGRRMEECISRVLLAQELGTFRSKRIQNRGVLLMVDFSKAYDSLIRTYLWEALRWVGFPETLIRLIKRTYTKTSAKFLVNGFESADFPITSGIRQGCPLAPLLFIIAMETIMEKIRTETGLTGVKFRVEGKLIELKTTGFVDDLCIFMSRSRQIPTALALLRAFGNISGLKINLQKSNGMWLDTNQTIPEYHGLSFLTHNDTVRYLGIQVGPGSSNTLNWEKFITKSQTRLFLASRRYNSLKGRVTIINAIFMAGVRFLAEFFPPSLSIRNQLENFILNFLKHYSLNTDKTAGRMAISRKILELPTKAGGLGLQNLMYELNKVNISKTLRWLHQPMSDIFPIKRMRLAIELKKAGETYYGPPEETFSISLSNRKLHGDGSIITGIKALQQAINSTLSSQILKVQEAQQIHMANLQDLYTLRFSGTTAYLEFAPWLKPKFQHQHKLLKTAMNQLIPETMLTQQCIFHNPLISLDGKILKALDFSSILPACSKVSRLQGLQEYQQGVAIPLYTSCSTYSLTRNEKNLWTKILKALWQSFPMLELPEASRMVTILTTSSIEVGPLLPTGKPNEYIQFNTKTNNSKLYTWDSDLLSFRHEPTASSLQITPHPQFTRLHINILDPPNTTNKKAYKKNQWWNKDWVKKWGKQQYTKEATQKMQYLHNSWLEEDKSIAAACREIKPKMVWSSGKGTPSMQYLQYRISIHRLPTWSMQEKGRCQKCSGMLKDNITHIFWDCYKHIWEILVWVWVGNKKTLGTHWQFALLSGKMYQPPGASQFLKASIIYNNLSFWEKTWHLLTLSTKAHIWFTRNKRVHERESSLFHLQGRWFLKSLASRLRQLRSQDLGNWHLYTAILRRTKLLPTPRIGPPTFSILAYFDGGSRNNPGIGGAGSWELQHFKNSYQLFLQSLRPFTPITNNEAEVIALLNILQANNNRKLKLSSTSLSIIGDSNILIKALNGKARIKNKKLLPFFNRIQYLLSSYHEWQASHTKRIGNKLADYLANIAMDSLAMPQLQINLALSYLRHDFSELQDTNISPSSRTNLKLQALPSTYRSPPGLPPKLLPMQSSTTRREATEGEIYPPHRVTQWSTPKLGRTQLAERAGLQPSGIG